MMTETAIAKKSKPIWRGALVLLVTWIAAFCLFFYGFSQCMTLAVDYASDQTGLLQLFYVCSEENSKNFNETRSGKYQVEPTEGQIKTFEVALTPDALLSRVYSPRIDIERMSGLRLYACRLTLLGMTIRTYNAEQLYMEYTQINDATISLGEDGFALFKATGKDPYIIYDGYPSCIKYIALLSIMCAALVTLVTALVRRVLSRQAKPVRRFTRQEVFVALFVALITLPNLMFFLREDALVSVNENRMLAKKPALQLQTLTWFPQRFEDYYIDHLPAKNKFTQLDSTIKLKLLHMSPSESVILGKENWLFYNSAVNADSDSLADYLCTNLFTQRELEDTASVLTAMRDSCEQCGAQFYVLFCPNKSTIYPEYMPDEYIPRGDTHAVDQLTQYLQENTDLTVIYPKEQLMAAKETATLYYLSDTHWNPLGAYEAYRLAIQTIEKQDRPALSEMSIIKSIRQSGDLATMINMSSGFEEPYPNLAAAKQVEPVAEPELGDDIIRYFNDEGLEKSVLIMRDSFGTGLLGSLSQYYREIYSQWNFDFRPELVDKLQPDIVIFEMVERSLQNITLTNATLY